MRTRRPVRKEQEPDEEAASFVSGRKLARGVSRCTICRPGPKRDAYERVLAASKAAGYTPPLRHTADWIRDKSGEACSAAGLTNHVNHDPRWAAASGRE